MWKKVIRSLSQRLRTLLERNRKWLPIGIGVKRWWLLSLLSAMALYHVIFVSPFFKWKWVEVLLLCGIFAYSQRAFARKLMLGAKFSHSQINSVVDVLYEKHVQRRKPKVVAIGGGTGLSTLLRGLKNEEFTIKAIVSLCDDGGSSGVIRRYLGIPPPGDIRKCIAALMRNEEELERYTGEMLEYRFDESFPDFRGHTVGNLLLVSLTKLTGNFMRAVEVLQKMFNIMGEIIPATTHEIVIGTVKESGDTSYEVGGETTIREVRGKVKEFFIKDESTVKVYRKAVDALRKADLIVLGPGSIFSSLLPNIKLREIKDAIHKNRKALKILVCNLAGETGETEKMGFSEMVELLETHFPFDIAIVQDPRKLPSDVPEKCWWKHHTKLYLPSPQNLNANKFKFYDVIDVERARNSDYRVIKHDSVKLARAIKSEFEKWRGGMRGE